GVDAAAASTPRASRARRESPRRAARLARAPQGRASSAQSAAARIARRRARRAYLAWPTAVIACSLRAQSALAAVSAAAIIRAHVDRLGHSLSAGHDRDRAVGGAARAQLEGLRGRRAPPAALYEY